MEHGSPRFSRRKRARASGSRSLGPCLKSEGISRPRDQPPDADLSIIAAAVARLVRAPVVMLASRVLDEQRTGAVGAGALHASASRLNCARRALVMAQ